MHFKSVFLIWIALALITCSHTEDPAKDTKLLKICGMPPELAENSGMTEYGGLLWNINDGGNEAAIYGFSASDTLLHQKVIIKGAVNTDWEEITQDDKHIFIGDFGNNLGDRRNLKIYMVDKSDLLPSSDTLPVTGEIDFSYENQADFTPAADFTTPWDCEAFVVLNDTVVLFTKDWQSNQTSLYTMPAKAGNYSARFRKRYNISGLVTAAAWSAAKHELLLLGYQNYPFYTPFIKVVPNFSLDNFTFDGSQRINYPNFGTQTEGIVCAGNGSVYVSCEQSRFTMQTLFKAEF